MSRRINKLFMVSSVTAITVTTIAFASWFFGEVNTIKKEAIQNLRVDDIYENYDTILSDTGGTKVGDSKYEIYIFPSAEYLQIYSDYLKNPTKNIKPEDFNGYLTPELNSDGTIKIGTNGLPIYTAHGHEITDYTSQKTYNFYDPNTNKVTTFNNSYKADNYVKRVEQQRYQGVGGHDHYNETSYVMPKSAPGFVNRRPNWSGDNGDGRVGIVEPEYAKAMNSIYGSYQNSKNRPYGAPTDMPFSKQELNTVFKDTINGYGNGQDGGKILFPVDRYGYWQDLTLEQGRFMPIKLTVLNSISPQVFYDSYGRINCSMQDGNPDPWFDLRFSGFTYVDFSQNSTGVLPLQDLIEKLPGEGKYTSGGPFGYREYYRWEKGIFPRDLFCTYDLNNVFDITKHLSTYADENNVIRLFPTFSNGKGYWGQQVNDIGYGGKDAIDTKETHTSLLNTTEIKFSHVPIYNNFTYNCNGINTTVSTLSNIPIGVNNSKTNFILRSDIANGSPGAWIGTWYTIYNLNFDPSDPNSDMKFLNGTGYYNFYFFMGNNNKSNTLNKKIDLYFDAKNYFKETNKFFDGKRLFHIPHNEGIVSACGNRRAVYLMAQKVTEPKIYMDLDPNMDPKEIQNKVDRNYKSAPTGFHLVRPMYVDRGGANLERVYENSTNNVYLIKGVDLTDVINPYFQMRFANLENNRIRYNLNAPGNNYGSPLEKEIIMSRTLANGGILNKDEVETKGAIFKPALGEGSGNFFTIEDTHPNFVKITEERNKGIYDFLLVRNPKIKPTADFDTVFDVYTYRHTNIFIKIFTEELVKTVTKTDLQTGDKADFVDHYTNTEIWVKKYYIGDVLSPNDKDDGQGKNKISRGTLDSILRQFIKDNSKYNFNNLVVRDRVTSASICWYEDTGGGNYTLKINPSFKVLKNYIFYITDDSELNK